MIKKLQIILLFSVQALAMVNCAPHGLPGVEETYILAGQTPSTVISCVIFSGVSASTIKWHHNNQDIVVDNQKYQLLSNTRLRINEIAGADEGTYSCSYVHYGVRTSTNLVCIFVLGAAGFATGETPSATDAFQGEDVALDTRVVYTGAGPSNGNQTVTLLQLFKQESTNDLRLVYFCSDEGSRKDSPCPSNDKVTATKGSHKFDLTLTLKNLSVEDGGDYFARVEVLRPGVSSRSYITKNFAIRMHEAFDLAIKQGENSLRCEASINEVNPGSVSLEWRNSHGEPLSANTDFLLTSSVSSDIVSLTAAFDTLTAEIEGQYFCTATLSVAGTSVVNRTVTTLLTKKSNISQGNNDSMFQVAIGPVSAIECSIWFDKMKSSMMEATIREGISAVVSERCNCTAQPSDFSIGQLHCVRESLHFKSSVQNAQKQEIILSAIDEWTSGDSPTMGLGVFSLDVSSSCSGSIRKKSLQIEQCMV